MPKKEPDKLNFWFPTLLQASNNIKTYSWFNIKEKINKNNNNKSLKVINTEYIKTKKFIIYPNNSQKKILQKWFHDVIKMYNITNKYIKNKLKFNKQLESYFIIRKNLIHQAKHIIKKNNINKHTLDYSIKHCLEMYKSAISNLKNKNIKSFDIKDLSYQRNRYNLVIEPNSFSIKKNGFFVNILGEMKSDRSLINFFKSNSILQYNKNSDKYYIISPFEYTIEHSNKRIDKCGIDLGIRTFATVYSHNKTLEIGSNTLDKIDNYNNKMDKIKSDLNNKKLSKVKYKKLLIKYGNKMRNKIDDMHKKVSTYLALKFNEINIGKLLVATKLDIS